MATTVEMIVLEERLDKLEKMLRHLHSNVENLLRKVEVNEHKIVAIACLVQTMSMGDYIDEKQLDAAINLDPEYYSSLDDMYSPIDNVDKVEWEEHVRKEKERDAENKRLDWNT